MKKQQLIIKQVDRQLEPWLRDKALFQPKNGWVQYLRKALGMTNAQLCKRLGLSRSRIIRIEKDELRGALTLRTLRETANALNCDLIYALVPKKPLSSLVKDQARKIVRQKMQRVAFSMLLENQAVNAQRQEEQVNELTDTLLQNHLKHIWDEEE